MAGSEAEERIRLKAERMLRLRWPDARIVHELNIDGGVVRIDLAAVTPNYLTMVEVKSEKDTLDRLEKQVKHAAAACDELWICVAPKHVEALRAMSGGVRRARIFVDEYPDPALDLMPHAMSWFKEPYLLDPKVRWDLLWAAEMRRAISRHFGGAQLPKTLTMPKMTRVALENMNGRDIRAAVCAQLRNRHFPRADLKASETPDAPSVPTAASSM